MLRLVHVVVLAVEPPRLVALVVVDAVLEDVDPPFAAVDVVGHVVGAPLHVAAAAEGFDAVGVLVDDREMIVDVAVLRVGALLPAAGAAGADGGHVLHRPRHLIERVDVLLDVEVAREPREVVPVPHLVLHFGHSGRSRPHPYPRGVPHGGERRDVADRAIVDAAHHLLQRG